MLAFADNVTFQLSEQTEVYVRVFAYGNHGTYSNFLVTCMLVRGTAAPSGYMPFANIRLITGATSVTVTRTGENGANAQSVTVSLVDSNNDPLTVYGGTLNVTTGELTVTHKLIDLSTVPIRAYTVYANSAAFAVSDMLIGTRWADGACSHARISTKSNDNGSGAMWLGIANNSVYWLNAISLVGAADLGEFTTWLSGAGVQLLYPLATPVTYQFTPAQLATLSGYNSVTTDAGTLSVTYRADTKLSLESA